MTSKILSKTLFIVGLVLFGWFLAGCSSTPDPKPTVSQQELDSTDEQIFVGDSLEMSYDPNVIMKRAETFFDKKSYAEAIVEYKHFLDLHRNHMLAPYAQYKIGMSYVKQFKTIDRDPAPLKQSIKAFQKLLANYPGSRHEKEAREQAHLSRERLAKYNLFVGQFYYRKESYLAAAHRFEHIIATFPNLDVAGDAMYHLAEAYHNLGANDWARDWLMALVQNYPKNGYREDGRQLLVQLQKEQPSLFTANASTIPSNPAIPINKPVLAKRFTHVAQIPQAAMVPVHNVSNVASFAGHDSQETGGISSQAIICSVGSWCESPTSSSSGKTTAPSLKPRVCQAGQWC